MPLYRLDSSLLLAAPRQEVFPFFADARNLEELTPAFLRFRIDREPERMEEGAEIEYRLRVHGLPLRWRSRIVAWDPPRRFTDVQLRGPYRVWEHEHRFEALGDTTRCIDEVRFGVLFGRVVVPLLVARDLRAIWSYRRRRLVELFGEVGEPAPEDVEIGPASD